MAIKRQSVKRREKPQAGESISEWVLTLIYVILIAGGIRSFLIEPFYIPSGSLVPTLLPGDFVVVTKWTYGYSRWSFPFAEPDFSGRIFGSYPKRGAIVVFALPREPSIDYIKRVIGEPGDTVQVTGGELYLNGKEAPRTPDGTYVESANDTGQGVPIRVKRYVEHLPDGVNHLIAKATNDGFANNTDLYTVPPGHLFMMGDNRDFSEDSRFLNAVGYVPIENVIGKGQLIWFSIDLRNPWWEFWFWPVEIRWDRLFTVIH